MTQFCGPSTNEPLFVRNGACSGTVRLTEAGRIYADPIIQTFRTFHENGDTSEVRALDLPGRGRPYTASGYYREIESAAAAALALDHDKPSSVYFVINKINPALYARSAETITFYPKNTTSDADIEQRRWLFLDFDFKRPAGISATHEEVEAAMQLGQHVALWLTGEHGWPRPIQAMSGNGWHLHFPADLPNDPEALAAVNHVLEQVGERFSKIDERVSVDRSVGNASRICTLYGTWKRKGHNTLERPHRRSQLVDVPEITERVSLGMIYTTFGKPKREQRDPHNTQKRGRNGQDRYQHRLKVDQWLHDKGISFTQKSEPDSKGRTVYLLTVCPLNSDHTDRSAVITQEPGGKLGAMCWHNGCKGAGWREFRQAIGEPEGHHYDPPRENAKRSKAKSVPKNAPLPPELADSLDDLDPRLPENRTDISNARRLLALRGTDLMYCHPWRKFIVWDGRRWNIDNIAQAQQWMQEVAEKLLEETDTMSEEIPEDAPEEVIAAINEAAAAARNFALQTSNLSRIKAGLELSTSRPGVPILHDDMNQKPFLLNCPNGTVDLKTGELQEHCRGDLLTVMCPTPYNPEAGSYQFDRFLESIFDGNGELIDFIGRWFGYCLSGSVQEQILPILWGDGSNGKSTLLNAVIDTLGADYAMQADPHLLVSGAKESQHTTYLASLYGKRFVSTVETESGKSINESFVKQLTGGERIRCRRMREDEWEFEPTHKIVLCTNHKPVVRGNDHAIWRRLALIPFVVTFWNPDKGESGSEELRQDKSLPEKLKSEAEGILAWMVRGCLEWQASGLKIPQTVRLATDDYRSEQDIIGRFISECCICHDANLRVKVGELYDCLAKWCEESGEELPAKKLLSQYLKRNGHGLTRDSYSRWYEGIGLKAFQRPMTE